MAADSCTSNSSSSKSSLELGLRGLSPLLCECKPVLIDKSSGSVCSGRATRSGKVTRGTDGGWRTTPPPPRLLLSSSSSSSSTHLWWSKWCLRRNLPRHLSHSNGFSLVWIRMCAFNWFESENFAEQWSQEYGRSPVCTLKWRLKLATWKATALVAKFRQRRLRRRRRKRSWGHFKGEKKKTCCHKDQKFDRWGSEEQNNWA